MNREDVIRLAREAGANPESWQIWPPTFSRKVDFTMAELERFAALVAAAEREACAQVCDRLAAEVDKYPSECAAAIRARSKP